MDRANLVRRRKQIREKENVVVDTNSSVGGPKAAVAKKKKTVKGQGTTPREDPQSETTSLKGGCEPEPNVSLDNAPRISSSPPAKENRPICSSKRPEVKPVYASQTNAGLVVRQLLQRSQFGDVKDYLQSVTKPELFQQALVVATYVQELKKKHSEVSEAAHEELVQYQAKYRSVAGNLAEREQIYEEQEKETSELVGRLKLAQEEYQSLITWIREHEEKFKTLQQTQQDQAQLIEEMSDIRRQREGQLNAVKREREQVFRFAEELQEQNTKLQEQLAMVERDCERFQTELKEEQETNKILTLETQRKAQTLKQMSRGVEDARNQISTLNGQVQFEAISRHSVTQERDRLQQQYQIDQQDWKSTQEHRDSLEKRKADEFRKMDLELRRLNQALSRMRIEWESEKSQREKSEARLHKLSSFLDETKVHTQELEEETQQLKMQLNEEKEARTSKDHALQIAHRDFQALQKSYREQENAKLDAQSEVASLVQRMKVIRRDHLALLHRVEAPTQLAAQWRTKMQTNEQSRHVD
ncbi:hypothetical protein PC129_g8261 [Phytophthora cactorum]|uniref:Uncharacterized protein n=1 Tax=Phytophthora cactorum TaxID=29920 RepID=A0A329RWW8_9STRA|nr:hypothetical protein Pcac1_g858 [Phytophthora cactorum]KAG2816305.1 hypothetical protein PC111_g13202 [Phytophthora cactorum]KAG2826447.1 hypothetical protein PC112_g9285 [Phytophthora cactorum]KAG2857489.1 hypothetical protein PC113_g10648 [Phytophthora cactorum]KAG2906704.1 hypothetical protein PC114_g11044 [Phytophthora cactorum]